MDVWLEAELCLILCKQKWSIEWHYLTMQTSAARRKQGAETAVTGQDLDMHMCSLKKPASVQTGESIQLFVIYLYLTT